jgi:hypothetical protein
MKFAMRKIYANIIVFLIVDIVNVVITAVVALMDLVTIMKLVRMVYVNLKLQSVILSVEI